MAGKDFGKFWQLKDYITNYSLLRGTNSYIVIKRLRLTVFSLQFILLGFYKYSSYHITFIISRIQIDRNMSYLSSSNLYALWCV